MFLNLRLRSWPFILLFTLTDGLHTKVAALPLPSYLLTFCPLHWAASVLLLFLLFWTYLTLLLLFTKSANLSSFWHFTFLQFKATYLSLSAGPLSIFCIIFYFQTFTKLYWFLLLFSICVLAQNIYNCVFSIFFRCSHPSWVPISFSCPRSIYYCFFGRGSSRYTFSCDWFYFSLDSRVLAEHVTISYPANFTFSTKSFLLISIKDSFLTCASRHLLNEKFVSKTHEDFSGRIILGRVCLSTEIRMLKFSMAAVLCLFKRYVQFAFAKNNLHVLLGWESCLYCFLYLF